MPRSPRLVTLQRSPDEPHDSCLGSSNGPAQAAALGALKNARRVTDDPHTAERDPLHLLERSTAGAGDALLLVQIMECLESARTASPSPSSRARHRPPRIER